MNIWLDNKNNVDLRSNRSILLHALDRVMRSKVTITCSCCRIADKFKINEVTLHDYYICKDCNELNLYQHPPTLNGYIRIIDLFAAADFIGYSMRLPPL
jgi:hypothetical protein